METRAITCDIKGCGCKPIWNQIGMDGTRRFCIWHCDLKRKKNQCEELQNCMVDMFAITEEDVQFIEKAQEVFEQVFTQKKEREKDKLNLKYYNLLNRYLKRIFKSLLRKCRKWREFNLRWDKEVMPTMEHQSDKLLISGVEKESINEKDSYFDSYYLLRYCDPKMLFELLSVSNDNIGIFSLGENPILTEETKEGIRLSTCEEIRSCIFKSYYLIERIYSKKELFQSLNLSKENNDLSDIDIFNRNANASEIGSTFKSLDSIKENEILESYGLEKIKIHQSKEFLLDNKRNPRNLTDVNIEAASCQHYAKCDKESFYYLPELGIQLCFKHNFHISYMLCTEYIPLFKLDLRQTLEIFHLLQNEVFKDPYCRDSELSSKLEDLIMKPNLLEHPFPHEHFIVLQNEILMNLTQCYEPSSKVRDFYNFEKILLDPIQNLCGLDIKKQANYWIPTSNYYESNPNFIKNMLKIEILEDIMENKLPKYLRKKQVDSEIEEIIECLRKDDIHKELESNIENIEFKIDIISPQKDKNDCFTDIAPNMQMRINCQNKSKKACTKKYSDIYEEPFEPSFGPSDFITKEKVQEKTNSRKISPEKDLAQEPKRDFQQGENNYDNIKDHSLSKVPFGKNDKDFNNGFLYSDGSDSEIGTYSEILRSINEYENLNHSSLGSESIKFSESNAKEECKAQNLEYSKANHLKYSEEIDSIENNTERDIKDLIGEAVQAVYTQRKRCSIEFDYGSLSEYFINKELYKRKLCDPNDPLLSRYDLSEFEEFREFASNTRWEDQISISSQDKIMAKLDTGENIENLSLIKTRLCEFETLELEITEEKCDTVRNFLTSYFPENCQCFKLSTTSLNNQIKFYFKALIELNFRVTEKLDILDWKLSQRQMMTVFQEFKHIRALKFQDCIFDLKSVPKFRSSLEGSKVKTIELKENEYGENGYKVNHLIEGLSQSNGFLQNLDTIRIYGEVNTEETKKILKEYADTVQLDINLTNYCSGIEYSISDPESIATSSTYFDFSIIDIEQKEHIEQMEHIEKIEHNDLISICHYSECYRRCCIDSDLNNSFCTV
ncbi:unnamed protein product [Moneuplotes crassus]|uniref:Uncharacterized protein n=1 Tax=Euplotes crassus TaxID=5936 RepID=A0AAD1XPS7_EUPCR|nr:unnamed protein product [Moneuplotes crassus]